MTSDSTAVPLRRPDVAEDPLTAVLRGGARRLPAQAVEAEAGAFPAAMRDRRLPDGRERVVRHGHAPERLVQTGIGPVAVRRVELRDRGAGEGGGGRIRFTPAILPRWARRTPGLEAPLPILHLRGVPMGDFQEAPAALLGRDAPNLSPSVIGRLRDAWQADHPRRRRRDLSARRCVYLWADGVHPQARMEPEAGCMPVPIGAAPEGRKELVGFRVGVRESAQSRRELLVGLEARGPATAPRSAAGDGSLGFWKALEAIFPATRHRRCWAHKTSNVLDKMPKSVQPAAKRDPREAGQAPDRATAAAAIDTFAAKHAAKCGKAVGCPIKDRDALLAFHDFPAERWGHPRTADPIEGVSATVRHRTARTKGAPSQDTARPTVFRLVTAAATTWRRLQGENPLPKVVRGVTFRDGVEVTDTPTQTAA